jgi:hypothetical protein
VLAGGVVIVRPADGEDIPWMLNELQSFADFLDTAYPMFPSLDHARTVLDALITQHVVFVAEDDGELRGFIAGLLAPHHFNPSVMTLTELLWWVTVEYRGSRAGALLLQAFLDHGRREANWIIMTLEDKSPVKADGLLKRGFVPFEHNYLCEVVK